MLRSIVFATAAVLTAQADPSSILTPKPGPAPKINGPRLYGGRPGKPFLYRVPCTGTRPIVFEVKGLPRGITFDGKTGIFGGFTPDKPGKYVVRIEARNRFGKSRRDFTIVAGEKLALTPPMGWNDWYTHYERITDADMRAAADAMISSGMADAGYQYVSIDDCWMRKPSGNAVSPGSEPALQPNADFPDMRALTDYIHRLGLKAGIYSSPGPLTCAKYAGSYGHEHSDATQFALWGFDLLKYDWCSYRTVAKNNSLEELQAPYRKMGSILRGLDRDIIFNLCQYGMGEVSKWGAEVGGHSWRTTGDLGLEKDTRLPGFYSIAFKNAELAAFAGPGAWNDPDYILIGQVGNARARNAPPQPSKLTPDEQYSYMSLWSLMASPLFFSGDMKRLDDFTLNVLTNSEVIDVNQDALGIQAAIVRKTEDEFVLARKLEDGSTAAGLFNLTAEPREIQVSWKELGLDRPPRSVRDLWRQKSENAGASFAATIPPHGVKMIRTAAR